MSVGPTLKFDTAQSLPMPLHCAATCEAGELLALVGPSGAGKTSMLRVLAGLMRPQSGHIQVGDEVWFDSQQAVFLPARSRHVGMVFQNYALMPHLDALQNVGLSLMHLSARERHEKAREWLGHVQLSDDQHTRRPCDLSGGQQQRVAVARALAREPRLLLLDEPFSAVDQMTRRGLYRLIADIRREFCIPIVLVTHDLHEASLMADKLIVMDAGQALQFGSPAAIRLSPRNARVADLVGIQNRFQGQWLGPAETPGWGLLRWIGDDSSSLQGLVLKVRDKGKIAPGQKVSWVVASDGLELWSTPTPSSAMFQATVVQAQHLGEITLAKLAVDDLPGGVFNLTLAGRHRSQVKVGEQHRIYLDQNMIHVMPSKS